MFNTLFRVVAGTAAAVALVAPATASATASTAPDGARASAKHFTVVQTFQKAKLDVCKKSVSSGNAWRVYGRLDTHKVRVGKYTGSLFVYSDANENPVATWRSPMTKKGTYSKVGSIRLPKKSGYSLAGGIGTANMGNGGPIKISRVGKC